VFKLSRVEDILVIHKISNDIVDVPNEALQDTDLYL
jgi:hypothetical protein